LILCFVFLCDTEVLLYCSGWPITPKLRSSSLGKKEGKKVGRKERREGGREGWRKERGRTHGIE
jgi:hypothetical protein